MLQEASRVNKQELICLRTFLARFWKCLLGTVDAQNPQKKTGGLVDGQCSFHPGGLFGIGDYTTHLYGDCNKPI